MSAIVGLLKPQQRLLADEFSQILVYESSNSDLTSSSDDGQGKVLDKAKEKSLAKVVNSKEKQDQRFIDMIRVQYARRHGVKIGFKGLRDSTFEFNDNPDDIS